MHKEKLLSIIKELIDKTTGGFGAANLTEEKPGNMWVSVEVAEAHLFTSREGEGLHALNHLVHRILEKHSYQGEERTESPAIVIDINGFQKKRVDNIRAVAHMMSERARYFKSNIEVDPMSAFERRIVHEFLADAEDLETESIGTGRTRRVVIKYKGDLK